jgi:hypothetical protein
MSRYVDVQTRQIAGRSFTVRSYECQVEEDLFRRYVVSEDGGTYSQDLSETELRDLWPEFDDMTHWGMTLEQVSHVNAMFRRSA